ncbi:MAG: hypothetical protein WCF36_05750 [Candidatus Nanopelagicales bacterium]
MTEWLRKGITTGLATLLIALALPTSPGVSPTAVAAPNAVALLPVRTPAAAAPRGRLAVGDSLMVSVTPRMRRTGFRVHAAVGRQFSTAPGVLRSYGAALPRQVVVELGTNGTVRAADCRAVVRTAGTHRRVFLVTPRVPRSWQQANLATLRACDRRYRASRVRIIDWYGHSAGHRRWFAADRIHLTSAGQRAFARLIDDAVDEHGLR